MQHTYIYSIYIGKAGGNGNFCGNLGKKKHYKKKVFPYIQHLQMQPFVSFIIVSFLSNELGNYFPHPPPYFLPNKSYRWSRWADHFGWINLKTNFCRPLWTQLPKEMFCQSMFRKFLLDLNLPESVVKKHKGEVTFSFESTKFTFGMCHISAEATFANFVDFSKAM